MPGSDHQCTAASYHNPYDHNIYGTTTPGSGGGKDNESHIRESIAIELRLNPVAFVADIYSSSTLSTILASQPPIWSNHFQFPARSWALNESNRFVYIISSSVIPIVYGKTIICDKQPSWEVLRKEVLVGQDPMRSFASRKVRPAWWRGKSSRTGGTYVFGGC